MFFINIILIPRYSLKISWLSLHLKNITAHGFVNPRIMQKRTNIVHECEKKNPCSMVINKTPSPHLLIYQGKNSESSVFAGVF